MRTCLLMIDSCPMAIFRSEDMVEAWAYVNQEQFQADLVAAFTDENGRLLWDGDSKLAVDYAPGWLHRRWEATAKFAVGEEYIDEPDDWVQFLPFLYHSELHEEAA